MGKSNVAKIVAVVRHRVDCVLLLLLKEGRHTRARVLLGRARAAAALAAGTVVALATAPMDKMGHQNDRVVDGHSEDCPEEVMEVVQACRLDEVQRRMANSNHCVAVATGDRGHPPTTWSCRHDIHVSYAWFLPVQLNL